MDGEVHTVDETFKWRERRGGFLYLQKRYRVIASSLSGGIVPLECYDVTTRSGGKFQCLDNKGNVIYQSKHNIQ